MLINNCYFVYNFENTSWEYSDQQTLNLRGFCLETNLKIYHSNHLWNEYMLEERMRFPSDDKTQEEIPWLFRKVTYFVGENNDELIELFNSLPKKWQNKIKQNCKENKIILFD